MAFTEKLKKHIRRRAHMLCCLCKGLGVEVHHIIPEAQDGPDTEENAAPLCSSCHSTYGANPEKRKFIREARDMWYEICEKRFASDPDRLDEIAAMLKNAVTKTDLDNAVENINDLLKKIIEGNSQTHEEKVQELSQTGGIFGGVGTNKHCRNCGTTIGLFIGDQGKCPDCGTPW